MSLALARVEDLSSLVRCRVLGSSACIGSWDRHYRTASVNVMPHRRYRAVSLLHSDVIATYTYQVWPALSIRGMGSCDDPLIIFVSGTAVTIGQSYVHA